MGVSIGSLRISWNAEKRLTAIDAPSFDIRKPAFETFAQLPPGASLAFHYTPILMRNNEVIYKDGRPIYGFQVLSELVFWDDKTDERIDGTGPIQTANDLAVEFNRMVALKKLSQSQKPTIKRHMLARFPLVNLGKLPATNVSAEVEAVT